MHNALLMENSALESGKTPEANRFNTSLANGPQLWTGSYRNLSGYHGPATAHKEQTIPKHGMAAWQGKLNQYADLDGVQ
jgi:hypothetical protein